GRAGGVGRLGRRGRRLIGDARRRRRCGGATRDKRERNTRRDGHEERHVKRISSDHRLLYYHNPGIIVKRIVLSALAGLLAVTGSTRAQTLVSPTESLVRNLDLLPLVSTELT